MCKPRNMSTIPISMIEAAASLSALFRIRKAVANHQRVGIRCSGEFHEFPGGHELHAFLAGRFGLDPIRIVVRT